MSFQLAFNFDPIPVSCPVQERYHAIAPVLSGNVSSFERAKQLNVSYSTVTRWLARFRDNGMPVRIGRWRVYVEEGLPKTPVQILFWDGKVRAEYKEKVLSEYAGQYSDEQRGVIRLEPSEHFETEYQTTQNELFKVGWKRDPVENSEEKPIIRRDLANELQLKLKFESAA